MARGLTYAVITPARDEARDLPRLAEALLAQTVHPQEWIIVDNGSTDGTREVAAAIAEENVRVRALSIAGERMPTRGGPVVRALEHGVAALEQPADVVVKVDADVSFGRDFFEYLLVEFGKDTRLGIASGVAFEHRNGRWLRRYSTRPHIHGQIHAFRRECLDQISPLDARMGWDTIDAVKAEANGWRARNFEHLPFRHHRPGGTRDARPGAWVNRGRAAHYMGYRPSYLLLRALYRARTDLGALGLLRGYIAAWLMREPRCADRAVVKRIRDEQRWRRLHARLRESTGRFR
jgi:glycosyltransferase involved in cell wall biosynthesis